MTTYAELDMVKIAEAEMATFRRLSMADRELLEMLADTEGGYFRRFVRVGNRLKVYWADVEMADLALADLHPGVRWSPREIA